MTKEIYLCVASTNPVKVSAAKNAFLAVFPDLVIQCEGMEALSGVANQPMTESETRLGAENRVRYCSNLDSENRFDYFVSMEGGVDKFEEGAATFAYVSILTKNMSLTTGRSANLPLPSKVFKRLENNEELGHVMDDIFNTSNIRQKGGAIGLLTNNVATRESIYTQALVLALAPILHAEHYL
ncbi:inosine/xanthosine triphosphatase [Marinomonas sp. C2222]|uniref:Inosine/xanthosine triphosphatase n=1 Tax=Marinomonas sargassi TaxID=2984494 RepID=A0ABT2YSD8_9GAMM|nr:inosine/xanthosine triphosphatase [Marinomonas sargassi]MCV2402807.1 inosine/xanthosine triphosphatase [Marinomonas sargassi]